MLQILPPFGDWFDRIVDAARARRRSFDPGLPDAAREVLREPFLHPQQDVSAFLEPFQGPLPPEAVAERLQSLGVRPDAAQAAPAPQQTQGAVPEGALAASLMAQPMGASSTRVAPPDDTPSLTGEVVRAGLGLMAAGGDVFGRRDPGRVPGRAEISNRPMSLFERMVPPETRERYRRTFAQTPILADFDRIVSTISEFAHPGDLESGAIRGLAGLASGVPLTRRIMGGPVEEAAGVVRHIDADPELEFMRPLLGDDEAASAARRAAQTTTEEVQVILDNPAFAPHPNVVGPSEAVMTPDGAVLVDRNRIAPSDVENAHRRLVAAATAAEHAVPVERAIATLGTDEFNRRADALLRARGWSGALNELGETRVFEGADFPRVEQQIDDVAFRDPSGAVFRAPGLEGPRPPSHESAMARFPEWQQRAMREAGAEEGFVDQFGNFMTRDEGEALRRQRAGRDELPPGVPEDRRRTARRMRGLRQENRTLRTDPMSGLTSQGASQSAVRRVDADPNQHFLGYDIKGLHDVNTNLGHEAGDALIESAGRALRGAGDEFGITNRNNLRPGGDEFGTIVDADMPEARREEIMARAREIFLENLSPEARAAGADLRFASGDTFAGAMDEAKRRVPATARTPGEAPPPTLAPRVPDRLPGQIETNMPGRWVDPTTATIETAPQDVAPANQWKGVLRKGQRSKTVDEWAGVERFLDEKGNERVTRQELLDHMEKNRPRFSEDVYSNDIQGAAGRPKFHSYMKAPGGSQYKETVVKLDNDPSLVKERAELHAEAAWLMDHVAGVPGRADRIREIGNILRETPVPHLFKGGHWSSSPNGLFNLLSDVRQIPGEGSALNVLEGQSDWHRAGREHGYQPRDPNAPGPERIVDLDALNEHLPVFDFHLKGAGIPDANDGDVIELLQNYNTSPRIREFVDEMFQGSVPDNLRQLIDNPALSPAPKIPDAPFKKPQEWVGLVIRRAIADAVEGGHNRVILPTGQQVSDRYNLRNHFAELSYEPGDNALHGYAYGDEARGIEGGDRTFDLPRRVSSMVVEQIDPLIDLRLNEALPPEVIDSMVFDPKQGRWVVEDLEAGGDWAFSLYDGVYKNVAKKEAKRLGLTFEEVEVPYIDNDVVMGEIMSKYTDEGLRLELADLAESLDGDDAALVDEVLEGLNDGMLVDEAVQIGEEADEDRVMTLLAEHFRHDSDEIEDMFRLQPSLRIDDPADVREKGFRSGAADPIALATIAAAGAAAFAAPRIIAMLSNAEGGGPGAEAPEPPPPGAVLPDLSFLQR